MANTLTSVMPKILAQGLLALRQNAIMPQLVNRGYELAAAGKGSTVDVPIPSAVTAQDVTPGATPPSTADSSPTSVSVPLDQWKEAPFYLTDKDLLEADRGVIPMQASEAIKALSNTVDSYIFTQMKAGTYGYAGVAGTTPFQTDLSEFLAARRILKNQLCPTDNLRVVMDALAEEKALNLRAIQDASWRQSAQGIVDGQIGRTLGAEWVADQNVATHTAGTAAGATTDNAGYAVGIKTVTLASAGTGTILAGDIITFAGDSQTYVVITGDSNVANGGTVVFEPGLKVAIAASATAITVKASHTCNYAFHRDALAFATRPLEDTNEEGIGNFMTAVDPISKLVLRLELTREHKRYRWSFDILYGGKLVRPEFSSRIAG